MPKLSGVQVAELAWNAGFRGSDLTRAVATARAESGNDPDVVNRIGATGLMQILQPLHVKTFPQWSQAWLKVPANNMAAARTLQQRDGWRPWDSSRGGQLLYWTWAAQQVQFFLTKRPETIAPQLGAVGEQAASGVASAVPGVGQLVDATERAGRWITTQSNILRIAYVLVGGTLLIVALAVIARPAVEEIAKVRPV